MLNIKDLAATKNMDSKAMARIQGGKGGPLSFIFDGSTSLNNRVADVQQLFAFGLSQQNAGAVTNNQAIQGGNGIVYAPVTQSLDQSSWMDIYDVGNTSVGG